MSLLLVMQALALCSFFFGTAFAAEEAGSSPVDCVVTGWMDNSDCSVSCGTGTMEEIRVIEIQAQNGGSPCPDSSELSRDKSCSLADCPASWNLPGSWTDCSVTCGDDGTKTRDVTCSTGIESDCDPNEKPITFLKCRQPPCVEGCKSEVSCSGNGEASDETGECVCQCFPGFQGTHCDHRAPLTAEDKAAIENDIGHVMHMGEEADFAHFLMRRAFKSMDLNENEVLDPEERAFLFIDLATGTAEAYQDPATGKVTREMYIKNLMMPRMKRLPETATEEQRIMVCKLELAIVDDDPSDDWDLLFGSDIDEIDFDAFVLFMTEQMNPDDSWTMQHWLDIVLDDHSDDNTNDHVFHMLEMIGVGSAEATAVAEYTETVNDCSGVSVVRRELAICGGICVGLIVMVAGTSFYGAVVQTVTQPGGWDTGDFLVNFGVNFIGNGLIVAGCAMGGIRGCILGGAIGGAMGNLFGSVMCDVRGGNGCMDWGQGDCCYQVSDFVWAAAVGAASGAAGGKNPTTKLELYKQTIPDAVKISYYGGLSASHYAEIEKGFQAAYKNLDTGDCLPHCENNYGACEWCGVAMCCRQNFGPCGDMGPTNETRCSPLNKEAVESGIRSLSQRLTRVRGRRIPSGALPALGTGRITYDTLGSAQQACFDSHDCNFIWRPVSDVKMEMHYRMWDSVTTFHYKAWKYYLFRTWREFDGVEFPYCPQWPKFHPEEEIYYFEFKGDANGHHTPELPNCPVIAHENDRVGPHGCYFQTWSDPSYPYAPHIHMYEEWVGDTPDLSGTAAVYVNCPSAQTVLYCYDHPHYRGNRLRMEHGWHNFVWSAENFPGKTPFYYHPEWNDKCKSFKFESCEFQTWGDDQYNYNHTTYGVIASEVRDVSSGKSTCPIPDTKLYCYTGDNWTGSKSPAIPNGWFNMVWPPQYFGPDKQPNTYLDFSTYNDKCKSFRYEGCYFETWDDPQFHFDYNKYMTAAASTKEVTTVKVTCDSPHQKLVCFDAPYWKGNRLELGHGYHNMVDWPQSYYGSNRHPMTPHPSSWNDNCKSFRWEIKSSTQTAGACWPGGSGNCLAEAAPAPAPSPGSSATVTLFTKRWGYENSWSISSSCKSTQTYESGKNYTKTCTLGSSYTVTCSDSNRDGWHGGYIKITQGSTTRYFCCDFSWGGSKVESSPGSACACSSSSGSSAYSYEYGDYYGGHGGYGDDGSSCIPSTLSLDYSENEVGVTPAESKVSEGHASKVSQEDVEAKNLASLEALSANTQDVTSQPQLVYGLAMMGAGSVLYFALQRARKLCAGKEYKEIASPNETYQHT